MALFSCYSGLVRQDVLFVQVDSIGTSRNTGSGNCCKTVRAIQRSDQKLWPISAVISIWGDKTSSSTSRHSIGTSRKTAFENYSRTLSAIQRSDQKFWPFSAVFPVWRDQISSSTMLIP
jgi:hypothetical protein